jgi:transposase-like protein
VERGQLEPLVTEGLSVLEIARRLGVGGTTVRHWLRKHELRTAQAVRLSEVPADRPDAIERTCATHGRTEFIRTGGGGYYRCRRCRSDHVSRRRRRVKAALVAEAGGRCVLCGYDRFAGALQFHHRDPMTKSFSLSDLGVARSLDKARAEARKCVLVCANCHAEVEAGIASIPRDRSIGRG